jgi:hypothetical protein
MSLLLTLKKVHPSIYEAQALAIKVFPVPGGPYRRIPFQGFLEPVKIYGNLIGIITAYFKAYLALYNPATSSHFTLGFSVTMACETLFIISCFSFLP